MAAAVNVAAQPIAAAAQPVWAFALTAATHPARCRPVLRLAQRGDRAFGKRFGGATRPMRTRLDHSHALAPSSNHLPSSKFFCRPHLLPMCQRRLVPRKRVLSRK